MKNNKIIILFAIIIVIFASWFAYGEIKERIDLREKISNELTYINYHKLNVYMNTKEHSELEQINNLIVFDKVETIELKEEYTFIGFDVRKKVPTTQDMIQLNHLLDQKDKLFSVCFIGATDWSFLEPIENYIDQYPGQSTIVYCNGNYSVDSEHYIIVNEGDINSNIKNNLLFQYHILYTVKNSYEEYYFSKNFR